MQLVLGMLVVAGSAVWVGIDASKRDWSESRVARNVPSWVVGTLLLWPIAFSLYFFVERKKAPLTGVAPQPEPAPAEAHEPEPVVEPEPVIDLQPEPAMKIQPESAMQIQPEPAVAAQPEPIVVMDSEPVVEVQPEPVVEVQPEPVVEVQPEPVVEVQPEPTVETVDEPAEEPDSLASPPLEISHPMAENGAGTVGLDWAALAAADQHPGATGAPADPVPAAPLEATPPPVGLDAPGPVVEEGEPLAPEAPAAPDEAPAGLSLDAFKDVKPVAFGAAAETDGPQPEAPPAEPVAADPLAAELDPVVAPPPPPIEPEPVFAEPEPLAVEPKPEPVALEPEPVAAMAPVAPQPVAPAKRGRPRLPGPELKLPKLTLPQIKLPAFGRKAKASADPSTGGEAAVKKSGGKGSFLSLPENLQGPLTDLERKIALGSVLAIFAAATFGYTTAPDGTEDPAVPPPPPAVGR